MISVAAPIGAALLGYACGGAIDWHVPSEPRRLEIVDLVYQPEAAGDYETACRLMKAIGPKQGRNTASSPFPNRTRFGVLISRPNRRTREAD
ncbi:MAG: hypothetical protein ACLFU6_06870 [Candidatus Hydrogenedentota bacterium]